MNLLNLLVKDIIPFAAANDLDLLFIIKLIDYRLATIEINLDNEFEVDTYISNLRALNSLFMLLGITANYTDTQRKAYDNHIVESTLINNPARITAYKEFKLTVIKEQCKNEIDKFDEYINLESADSNE